MIIPVRCFTCNKVVGNKWKTFEKLRSENVSHEDIFKQLGLTRYCCKRMLTTHVELIDKLLLYSPQLDENQKMQSSLPSTVTLNNYTNHPRIYDAV